MTRIGVDVGGTFTDVITVRPDGTIRSDKTPSTPAEPEEGVLDGLERAIDAGVDGPTVEFLGHGTTVTTNAVLEGELPPTALVTTAGFRDVLEIGRQDRPALYDLSFERADPIVPRDRRFTVPERVGPDGEIISPLEDADARSVAEQIPDSVEAVAISTLFSFREETHERRLEEAIARERPDVTVSRSAAVLPEFREYERTSTTAMNAALAPLIRSYLAGLQAGSEDLGIDQDWAVMQSNGGLMRGTAATERPVTTLLSGPAAGVKGAEYLAAAAGHEDVLTMDMGGTSTDVSLIEGGEPTHTTDWHIGDHPVRVPAVDIETIGAGGGSIAWIDEGGALRVGPRSAGADPGPAAYGRGGQRATVTDAHVVLGRLHPDYPLGGTLSVDVEAAEAAIERDVAEPLEQSLVESARGILAVARANMERALRVVTVERGRDPRRFALVAFGGAGPLHGPGLAAELSIPTVLVPRKSGVLSALGLLTSDLTHTFVTSMVTPVRDLSDEDLRSRFRSMIERGRDQLASEGIEGTHMSFEPGLDLRYVGQSYSLQVPLSTVPGPAAETGEIPGGIDLESAIAAFHRAHESRYGHADVDEPVELENLRLVARGEIPSVDLSFEPGTTLDEAVQGQRNVVFESTEELATVYDHDRLPPGSSFDGPAIVHGSAATTVVPPDQSVAVDDRGTLDISTGAGGTAGGDVEAGPSSVPGGGDGA
ncbi:MAG: hydantoinase/oxoprolinase family protein [Halodesulfurarchaeum sp.]